MDAGDPVHAPSDDILRQPRAFGGVPDLGGYETGVDALFADDLESGGTGSWSGAVP